MAFSYRDPRMGELVIVEQAVHSASAAAGGGGDTLRGLLRSGLLRHPLFVSWTTEALG
jgi:hypothetical protein